MTVESLIIIFAALAFGSFAKGLTGLGLPAVAIAILSAFFGVQHAIVVATIPVAFANLQVVWTWRHRMREMPPVFWSLVSAGACVAVGTWILANIDEHLLTIILAVWIGVFLITAAFNLRIEASGRTVRILTPVIAGAAGICQGATGISGPFIGTWGYALGFVKETYVFAISLLFTSISVMHVVTVGIAGLYDQERIIQGLLAIIPAVLFVPLGMRMATKVSPRVFRLVIVGVIAIMEVKLVWGLLAGS